MIAGRIADRVTSIATRVMLAGGVTIIVVGHLLALPLPDTRDAGVFAYSGWRLGAGDVPYRDFFDHKPPLVFAIYAVADALGGVWAVRIIDLLLLVVATIAVGFIATRVTEDRRIAIAAAGVFALTAGSVSTGQSWGLTETLSMGLTVPAFALLIQDMRAANTEPRRAKYAAIGLLGGLGALIRLSAGLDVVALLAGVVLLSASNSRARNVAAFLSGVALPGIIYLAYAIATNSVGVAFDALVIYNGVYAATRDPLYEPYSTAVAVTQSLWPEFLAAFVAAPIAVAAALIARGRKDRARVLLVLLLWLTTTVVTIVAPQRFYPHYFALISAPLSMLILLLPRAALGLSLPAIGAAYLLTISSTVSVFANTVPMTLDRMRGKSTVQERVAGILDARTLPANLVLVWGSEADVLYLARRESATRYIYILPFYLPGGGRRYEEFLNAASHESPTAVVLAPDRATGAQPVLPDSFCALLNQFHRRVGDLDGFWLVYTRTPGDVSFDDDLRAGRVSCARDADLFGSIPTVDLDAETQVPDI